MITIPGPPTPLKRARHGKRNVYDSQKNLKAVHGILMKQEFTDPPLAGPLHMSFRFYMPLPIYKKKHQAQDLPHYSTPDLSNLIKYYEDVANGILFTDDRLISSISAIKLYDKDPRTEITITQIQEKE